jgi:glycosyltransferase involved in cell wall biosynthesis
MTSTLRHTRTLSIASLPYSRDGSSYYRLWLPFKHLKANSFHAYYTYPEEMNQDVPDVTVLQRPAGVGGMQMIEKIIGQTKVVYESDDDMLQVDPSGLPHLYDERLRESVRRCLRMVDMVTVSSEGLAETIRPFNENVVVLPNFIKASALEIPRPKRDRLTVGWAGGTSHLVDMVTIQDVLWRMLANNPQIDLHFVGFDFSPLLGEHRGQCRRTNWNDDVGHYYRNIDFDIAIAPSADIPFNRSKTPLRALEMAALGIPIVASNLPPYDDFVQHDVTGFLVSTQREWEDAIQTLIKEPALRQKMGAAAKEQAAELTIEKNWHLWEAAYEKAAAL